MAIWVPAWAMLLLLALLAGAAGLVILIVLIRPRRVQRGFPVELKERETR